MGAVCCISAKGATTSEGANGEILRRTIQYSPSWGIRWDNRGRVAGEGAPASVIVDRVGRNGRLENKSETFFEPLTEVEMSDENLDANPQTQSKTHVSGSSEALSVSISMEVKEIAEMPADLDHTRPVLRDMPSASYLSTSPLPHTINIAPAGPNPLNWSPPISRSPLVRQGSYGELLGHKSPNSYSASGKSSPLLLASSIESAQGSQGRSVNSWSVQSFHGNATSTHRETWPLDTDSLSPHHYNLAQPDSRKSESHSSELTTCVVCSKYVDVYVVAAILICGHVYHADCLDHLTPEIKKYDPPCPVCTFGEKKAIKILKKLVKAEMDMMHRNCVSKSGFFAPALESSSSLRSSLARPFLKRHFSLGSRASSSSTENHLNRKRSLLWSKSSK